MRGLRLLTFGVPASLVACSLLIDLEDLSNGEPALAAPGVDATTPRSDGASDARLVVREDWTVAPPSSDWIGDLLTKGDVTQGSEGLCATLPTAVGLSTLSLEFASKVVAPRAFVRVSYKYVFADATTDAGVSRQDTPIAVFGAGFKVAAGSSVWPWIVSSRAIVLGDQSQSQLVLDSDGSRGTMAELDGSVLESDELRIDMEISHGRAFGQLYRRSPSTSSFDFVKSVLLEPLPSDSPEPIVGYIPTVHFSNFGGGEQARCIRNVEVWALLEDAPLP